MTTRTYTVPGISCDHCRRAIEADVGGVTGVERVVVDVAARTVAVTGDAADDAVRAAIGDAGYEVVSVVVDG
jgi:copper chaperone CopZ